MTRSTAVVAIELGVMPTKGATGQIAHNDEEKDTFKVEDMPSVALGKVGVDHENAFQQRMLQTLDTTLIECAHSESLRALWVMMRPAFVEHLKYAKYLQSGRN